MTTPAMLCLPAPRIAGLLPPQRYVAVERANITHWSAPGIWITTSAGTFAVQDERRLGESFAELVRPSTLLPLTGHWYGVADGDPRAFALYQRHYSYRTYKSGRTNRLIAGPGEKMVLLTYQCDALFVWRKFDDMRHEPGINCAVFRNESSIRASDLIREAMELAWQRWPGERLYTYVNSKKIKSTNPGYCYKMAGWKVCGETKGGLLILEALPDGYEAKEPEATAPRAVIVGDLWQLAMWKEVA